MNNARPIRRALLSVSNKDGIIEFAKSLHAQGVELLSTGGTARLLAQQGLPVIEVSDYTGHPEIMDGRVKTLHPKIHGGILARRGMDELVMEQNKIQPIDLVAVNLYPFAETIAKEGCTLANAIENIDIGGPTMVRATAKNHKDTTIIVNVADYARVIKEMLENHGSTRPETRFDLAIAAFEHTAAYDGMIANYFGTKVADYDQQTSSDSSDTTQTASKYPRTYNTQLIKKQDLRYGENSHQTAAFYVDSHIEEVSVASAIQLQGKALSYNNIADTDTALECVKEFDQPACVIVKHANPCGVALGHDLLDAYNRAYKTDPTSAFGGIIALNGELDAVTAQAIIERQFVEVIIAPSISIAAKEIVATKANVRLLECGQWQQKTTSFDYKRVNGGLLIQDRDRGMVDLDSVTVVTQKQPTKGQMQDLLFCWKVAKFVKSNAIVYAKDSMTIGVGAGQMSRVYSAKVAGIKAIDEQLTVAGSVMASDAFFPFRDGIDAAADAGISCIIQPGGSIRDEEIIAAADEHSIAMVFTGMRHFRH